MATFTESMNQHRQCAYVNMENKSGPKAQYILYIPFIWWWVAEERYAISNSTQTSATQRPATPLASEYLLNPYGSEYTVRPKQFIFAYTQTHIPRQASRATIASISHWNKLGKFIAIELLCKQMKVSSSAFGINILKQISIARVNWIEQVLAAAAMKAQLPNTHPRTTTPMTRRTKNEREIVWRNGLGALAARPKSSGRKYENFKKQTKSPFYSI